MKFKNKVHKGMTVFPDPVWKKIGSWNELQFDASMVRFGLTWLRVYMGMGGRGDREDWVAEVPGQTVAIHDYNWDKTQSFGQKYDSPEAAMLSQIKMSAEYGAQRAQELIDQAVEYKIGVKYLLTAASKEAM